MKRARASSVPVNAKTTIETDACLLVFDSHQNIEWVRSILNKERDRISHVLLGGDYFDAPPKAGTASVEETCQFLKDVAAEWGDRVTFLLGNHDVHYVEAKRWCDQRRSPRNLNYKCSGYTNNKAKKIASKLDWDFWRGCRLFQVVNGWLISHAGVAGLYWPNDLPVDQALVNLEATCADILQRFPFQDFPMLHGGRARDGTEEIGGPTWLDFNFEFADDEVPLPQIFGHTCSNHGAKQKGRSWCLDGAQTCYAVLHCSGTLEHFERP